MNLQHRLLVPALAAGLALTGCAGDDAKTDLPLGPISQHLSDLDFDDDITVVLIAAQEDLVAACMKEQGFDYTPTSLDTDQVAALLDWGSEEFTQTYGYGITTTWQDIPEMATTETETLDESSQVMYEAYQEALWGTGLGEDEDDGETWLPGGCYGEAFAQLGMGLLTSTVAQDITDLTRQVDADDTVVAALYEWSVCMADQGYHYETPTEAQSSIQERAFTDDGQTVSGAALTELQEEEIATAVADHKCSTDLERIRAIVLARLETDYYADHKTEVDAFLVQVEEFLTQG
ncbi:MAG: hypothetical protein FWH11_10210 [Micrococcales bacterium]|nr:hypothetical protein [Micrococcales bacterium]